MDNSDEEHTYPGLNLKKSNIPCCFKNPRKDIPPVNNTENRNNKNDNNENKNIAKEEINIEASKNIRILEYNKLDLTNHLTDIGTKLLIDTIPLILDNKHNLTHQDQSRATYANKITSESRQINFDSSKKNILNHIRAHAPKPGAWFTFKNERIKIIEARAGRDKGERSTILNNKFEIGCEDGSIEPLILQREGRNIINKDEFIRGFIFNINDIVNA